MLVMWECDKKCGGERCIIAVELKNLDAYEGSIEGIEDPKCECLFDTGNKMRWILLTK